MVYYIADTHFGHKNVIRFDNRPFADTTLMDEVLVHNWNERVTEDDTVYILGDAFWKNEENSVKLIHFESIEHYAEINDNEKLVVMSHYPIPFYKCQHYGAVMLYGHVHNTREWELIEKWKKEMWDMEIPCQMINVGCMMPYMRYTPRTLEEILKANPAPEFRKKRVEDE